MFLHALSVMRSYCGRVRPQMALKHLMVGAACAALSMIFACGEHKDICDEIGDYLGELRCVEFSVYRPPNPAQCRSDSRARCMAGCVVDLRPSCVDFNTPVYPGSSDLQMSLDVCFHDCVFDGG